MSAKDRCQKQLRSLSSRPEYCNRPAEEEVDSKKLCKRHAASVRRNKTRNENRRKAEEEYQQRVTGWEERMEQAVKVLGVSAQLDAIGPYYRNAVVISLDDFEKLAEAKLEAK